MLSINITLLPWLYLCNGACENLLLPVLAVVKLPVNIESSWIIDLSVNAVESDCETAWIGSRLVKRLNTTNSTKLVPGHFRSKLVESYLFFAFKKFKVFAGDYKVVILFHVTDGAVALVDTNFLFSLKTKSDGATVAAAVHRNLHSKYNRFEY